METSLSLLSQLYPPKLDKERLTTLQLKQSLIIKSFCSSISSHLNLFTISWGFLGIIWIGIIWNYIVDPSAQHHSVFASWPGNDQSIKCVLFVKLYKIIQLVKCWFLLKFILKCFTRFDHIWPICNFQNFSDCPKYKLLK